MGFLDDELQEVSKLCHNVIPGSLLVTCFPTMVRVEITKTIFKKIIVCIQFSKIYPSDILLLELKSKTLSQKLLSGLTEICEKNCKNLIGKAQILPTLKFLNNFIDENPLICCYDEINLSKKLLKSCDNLRLKQKISTIYLEVHSEAYFFKTKIFIPDDYPSTSAKLTEVVTNFPPLFERYLLGQAKELGRRCVEPPLRKLPNKLFKPSPSLDKITSFIISSVKQIPEENCQLCKVKCLPENPKNIICDENADLHIERLYCSHLFHLQCLVTFMKTPPFHGGKKCPSCNERVYHEKWGLSEKLAEDRWAHEQARSRELAEVTDFFV